MWFLVSHLLGRVNAAWTLNSGYVVFRLILFASTIIALAAAYGFLKRKRWALRLEFLVVLCFLLVWAIEPLIRVKPYSILEFLAHTVFLLLIASPMLNVPELRGSVVFDPEYTHTVEMTSYIRVGPDLSLDLKLIAIAVFVVFAILLGFDAILNPT